MEAGESRFPAIGVMRLAGVSSPDRVWAAGQPGLHTMSPRLSDGPGRHADSQ